MYVCLFFFFQAEDGIRDLVRSRGLGDVYKRQREIRAAMQTAEENLANGRRTILFVDEIHRFNKGPVSYTHLTLPTSDLV